MARCAVIENGRVVNLAEATEDFALEMGWVVSHEARMGDLYEKGVFLEAPALPVAVPAAVTMRQARLALHGAGLLDDVNTALLTMTGPEGEAARIEWEFAAEVRRDWPLLEQLAPALGLTDAQVDALFLAANQL